MKRARRKSTKAKTRRVLVPGPPGPPGFPGPMGLTGEPGKNGSDAKLTPEFIRFMAKVLNTTADAMETDRLVMDFGR